jgi:hypothetical protein
MALANTGLSQKKFCPYGDKQMRDSSTSSLAFFGEAAPEKWGSHSKY